MENKGGLEMEEIKKKILYRCPECKQTYELDELIRAEYKDRVQYYCPDAYCDTPTFELIFKKGG